MSWTTEVPRKLFHLLTGGYILMYLALPKSACLGALAVLGVAAATLEWLRLTRPELNALFSRYFHRLQRAEESTRPTAILYGIVGAFVTILVFDNRDVVIAALGFLVFGDAAAALGGKAFGKRRWPWAPDKSQEGSLAFATVCSVWGLFFLPAPVAVLGAVASALLESLPLPGNDNFWIPVLAGAVLSTLSLLF